MTGRVRLEYGPKDGFARHGRQTVHFGLGSARWSPREASALSFGRFRGAI